MFRKRHLIQGSNFLGDSFTNSNDVTTQIQFEKENSPSNNRRCLGNTSWFHFKLLLQKANTVSWFC